MATGYITNNGSYTGEDLDTLFKARTSTKTDDVGYDDGGVDLSNTFEPIDGSPAINPTGYVSTVNPHTGQDLANIFMDINHGGVNITGGGAPEWFDTGNSARTVGLRVNSDGTLDYYSTGSSSWLQADASTDWIIPNSASSAATYHVKADYTGDTLRAGSSATGSWIDVDLNPYWWLQDTDSGASAKTGTLTLSISDDGGSTTIDSGVYNFTANYDIT